MQLLIKAVFEESQKKCLHHLQWHIFLCMSPSPRVKETPDINIPRVD